MPTLMNKICLATGDKQSATISCLVDTGASFSFVREALADGLGTIVPLPRPMIFTLGDGNTISIDKAITLNLQLEGGVTVTDTFMVIAQGVEQCVLGAGTMRKFGLKIDMERSQIYAAIITTNTKPTKRQEDSMEKLKALCAKFGISAPEGMTEEQALAGIEAKLATPMPATKPASLAVLKELELPETATEPEITGKIVALKHPGNVVSAEVHNAVLAQLKAKEVESAVTTALQSGKIAPSELTWCEKMAEEDLPKFAAFIATRGKVVPIASKLPEQKQEQKHQAKVGDDELAIFAQLGVTVEEVVKANPKTA